MRARDYPRYKVQRLQHWRTNSPWIVMVWRKPGRGGDALRHGQGRARVFKTIEDAERAARQALGLPAAEGV